MKINFVASEITRTGGMNIIFQYANRLTDRGHKVILYAPIIPFNPYKWRIKRHYIFYQYRYARELLKAGKKPPANIYPYKFEIKYAPLMKNFFVEDADVIIATAWNTTYPVNNLGKSKGRKYYLIQDYEIWNSNPKYVDRSYRLPLRRIVCSKYMKNFLKNKLDVDCKLIPIGLDYERFNNRDKRFNREKQILFMDHSLPNKNFEGALYTIKKLREKYPELRFKCFGQRRFHETPGYVEYIENPGDKEITGLYSESDIFIFPSKYEGYGSPPAEAMACNCAVVANAIGAVPEYAVHNESAILCDPNEEDGLYNGVCYLLENQKDLERISLAAGEYVRKVLDWDRSVDEFENFLKEK